MLRRNITALILAGGRSSRMGALKPLQHLSGKPAIQWAVEVFRNAGIEDVSVVVGFHSDKLISALEPLDVRIIINPDPERGMFSSVQAGLETFGRDVKAFFLLPGDMPMIRDKTVKKILEAYGDCNENVIYPVFLGERGHPPLIPRQCFNGIRSAGHDENLRGVLNGYEADALEVGCADSGILMDMDTPEDYQEMINYCRNRSIPVGGECDMLFKLYRTPEPVIRHGRAVAAVASEIAGRLNHGAHINLDIPLIHAAGILHDIARCEPNHASVGAEILAQEGFTSLSESVAVHMDLQLPVGEFQIGCKEILYLADKMVEEDRFMPLEQRFSNAVKRNESASAPSEKVASRLMTAQRIKRQIECYLGLEDLYTALCRQAQ